MGPLRAECPGWWYEPVFVARSFGRRMLGVAGLPPEAALLLPSRFVHGLWIRHELAVVGLDRRMAVCAVRRLEPRRFLGLAGACRVLELPEGSPVPPIGARIRLSRPAAPVS